MDYRAVLIIGVLLIALAAAFIYLVSLRSALKEVSRELDDKLKTDTNTLIRISSGDKSIRLIVLKINNQLRLLRKERMRLSYGDKELKNAVTNISHDLRTPLTAVSGYLDLASHEQQSENMKRYLNIIRERTDVMKNLTDELFRYSVIASDSDELNFQDICVNDVLEQSLAGFYGVLSERGIEPYIEIENTPIIRNLDKTALRRIFDNILNNASKYSDGDLTVKLTSDGTAVFENSAKKLDPVLSARLFDRFFTVNTARESTGLGLSIAKLLTEKMNGSISAEYINGKLRIAVCFNRSN